MPGPSNEDIVIDARQHGQSVFWEDLAADLQDPDFRRHYENDLKRIARLDRQVNARRSTGQEHDG